MNEAKNPMADDNVGTVVALVVTISVRPRFSAWPVFHWGSCTDTFSITLMDFCVNKSKRNSYRKSKTNISPPPWLERGFTPPGGSDMPIGDPTAHPFWEQHPWLDQVVSLVNSGAWGVDIVGKYIFSPSHGTPGLPQGAPFDKILSERIPIHGNLSFPHAFPSIIPGRVPGHGKSSPGYFSFQVPVCHLFLFCMHYL